MPKLYIPFITTNNFIITKTEKELDQCIPEFIKNIYQEIIWDTPVRNLRHMKFSVYQKKVHIFGTNVYLLFVHENEYYVDIHHILSKMTLDEEIYEKIFGQFSELIQDTIFDITEKGEITVRELIKYSDMGKIILSQNCNYSIQYRYECILMIILIRILLFYFLLIQYLF